MLAQYAAEEQEEGKPVDDAAGPDVPSRLSYKKGKHTASYPEGEEDVRSDVPVEIEQAPRQEKERKGVGKQMPETAMHQRVCENTKHTPSLQRIYP